MQPYDTARHLPRNIYALCMQLMPRHHFGPCNGLGGCTCIYICSLAHQSLHHLVLVHLCIHVGIIRTFIYMHNFYSTAEVKRAGDNQIGVHTQCLVASTLRKTDPSTLTNVCLKINVKLGGTNSAISRY